MHVIRILEPRGGLFRCPAGPTDAHLGASRGPRRRRHRTVVADFLFRASDPTRTTTHPTPPHPWTPLSLPTAPPSPPPTPCSTASASPNVGSGHNRRSAGAVLVRGAGPGLMHRLRLLVTARWWAGGGGLLLLLWALQAPHPSTLGATASRYEEARNRPSVCWWVPYDAYRPPGPFGPLCTTPATHPAQIATRARQF